MVVENWLQGRKRHVWLSVSPDLEHDARRDLSDLEEQEYRECFNLFDKDQTGRVQRSEIGLLFRALGYCFSDKRIMEIQQ